MGMGTWEWGSVHMGMWGGEVGDTGMGVWEVRAEQRCR